MQFYSTRQVARLLGIPPARLTKAIWDDRVSPPAKGPAGNFLWTLQDVQKVSWALLHRAFEASPEILTMVNHGPVAL